MDVLELAKIGEVSAGYSFHRRIIFYRNARIYASAARRQDFPRLPTPFFGVRGLHFGPEHLSDIPAI